MLLERYCIVRCRWKRKLLAGRNTGRLILRILRHPGRASINETNVGTGIYWSITITICDTCSCLRTRLDVLISSKIINESIRARPLTLKLLHRILAGVIVAVSDGVQSNLDIIRVYMCRHSPDISNKCILSGTFFASLDWEFEITTSESTRCCPCRAVFQNPNNDRRTCHAL